MNKVMRLLHASGVKVPKSLYKLNQFVAADAETIDGREVPLVWPEDGPSSEQIAYRSIVDVTRQLLRMQRELLPPGVVLTRARHSGSH